MSSMRQTSDRSIDWEAVKSRIARTAEGVAAAEHYSPEQTREILLARADRLAQISTPTPDASEILELLTFQLGDEAFAIETHWVREVFRPGEVSVVPGVPSFLVGVTNLRGEVLAVMDLRRFFGSQASTVDEQRRVIVLGRERPEFGIVADLVDEVTTRRTDELLPVPASVSGQGRRYLKGVTADAMLIIDCELLLQDSSLYVDQDD